MHGGVAKADLLAPGTNVGRYRLLRRLAIGGMAELHLACASGVGGFQKIVVLKRVLPHLAADAGFVRMFLDEARLAGHLDHPNVVQVIDSGEAEGEYFYVMEYVHGRNARELLGAASHAGGMPLPVALTIVIGIASALDHAHGRVDLEGRPLDLVHRDVSPSNVLVSYEGAVKLTDFGIAKAATRSQETTAGTMKGKIGYMSPEQCRGEAVDRRSDIFSLGVVLFELTTCERLFFGDSDFAVLNKVVSGRFERPTQRIAGYPPELEQIVMRALATDRADRYESADAVRRDLEIFAEQARLRIGVDTLSQWMRASFGMPPYPRVEVREPVEDAIETAPTVVLVDGEPTIAIDEPTVLRDDVQETVARVEPLPVRGEIETATIPRSRAPVAVLAIGGVAAVAIVGWFALSPTSRAEPTSAPERPATRIEEAAIATPAPVRSEPARSEPAPAPKPSAAAEPSEATSRPTKSSRARKSRDRARPSASTSTPTPPRDLDALYPDKK